MDTPTPVGDYALVGDTRTAALIASDGTIEWMCAPRFDGEPVFATLVGGPAAGSFRLGPVGPAPSVERRYRVETATVETMWATPTGRLLLTEGMVADVGRRLLPTTLLVRRLTALDDAVDAVVRFDPRRGERHRPPRWRRHRDALVGAWRTTALAITCTPRIPIVPGRETVVTVRPQEPVTLALGVVDREPLVFVDAERAWNALADDELAWRAWCSELTGDVPHRDAVVRSAVTLRLLTYSPSGAPVAAPTTSLPEELGGVRNWDYRFAWPRDASIGIAAFLALGKHDEARHFLAWLLHASRLDRPRLPVLLSLHGRHPSVEHELRDWPGYAESRPVRFGNAAADQHQLDGYGWVVHAAWLMNDAGHRLSSETWRAMRGFADEVARRWREPDSGIWEVRSEPAHHVHSKVMAWVALDRALRIADTRRTASRHVARWRAERDAIADDVRANGFDAAMDSYTRTYGSHDLDAAFLAVATTGIEPPTSPRIRATIAAIRRVLGAGGPLLYRYRPGTDGLAGGEGAFLPCAFWLVEALAAAGDVETAHAYFDELIALASPLGLYGEEMDPESRQHLGNFPQALTHAGLIGAAIALARAAHPDADSGLLGAAQPLGECP